MNALDSTNSSRRKTVRDSQPTRLTETTAQRLRESGYPMLGRIVCTCSAGVARLTGNVPTYYLKQVAQTIVFNINGIEQVHNHLEVVPLRERVRTN